LEGRLIDPFMIRPIAQDRPITGGGDRRQVIDGDLPGNTNFWTE